MSGAIAHTGSAYLNKFTGPARAQARLSELAGMPWFGLLYMGKLAVLSGLASSTHGASTRPIGRCSISAPQHVPRVGAALWIFGLTAHQLAILCVRMAALSTPLVEGYSVPAQQLDRLGFLCVVMPNTRAECERKPPNRSPLDENPLSPGVVVTILYCTWLHSAKRASYISNIPVDVRQ
jgi:hypothetical protein